MASIEITNDNKIKVNVNSSDSWSLNLNNSNFMLKKYNGIGTSIVELKTFSNVGELFGEIELYVNGKLCNNYDLKQIDNVESDFFYIIPNVINLNGKGDVRNVIVYTNDSQWEYEILNNNNRIIVSKENNNLIITSNIDEIFYDLRIKIYSNNLDGKPYDYVTVNQTFKSYISEEEGDLFKVNPTYLLFTKPNEVKNVTVTTSCKDGYEISTVTTPFSLTDNGKCKLSVKYIGDGKTSASTSFNVTSCGSSKKVDIKYDNSFNLQNYLYIISGDTQYNGVTTSLVKNGENDSLGILEYELSSTSKVMVYSKPSQIVASVSKLDDNNSYKLRVQFDNNEDFQGQIKLRNNDGIFAYINISISGYGDAKGIVFKFNDTNENTKVIEPNENGEYSITIDSYYNKDKSPLNFNIHTNYFDLVPSSTTKPYIPSSTSTTLTFKAKENVKGNKTIQLEEVETFKRLYIKINIDYGNSYYNFYFVDGNNNEYYSWYLTYDYKGELLNSETQMYSRIISLSGGSLNEINKEVTFTPSGYSKDELGIVSGLTGSTNYYSSFTFTQSGSNNELTLYVTQVSAEAPSDVYVIEHGGDGSVSYSKTFCLNERTLAGYIICSTNGSYVEPIFNDIIGIDDDGITIDFGTPNGTEVPFYFTLTKKPNQSTITPTFCHPNGGCVFFTITATVNDCNESKTCIKLVHGAQPFCYNQTSYAGGLDFELFEGDNCQSYVESAPTSSIVLITDGEGCNLQGGRIEYESNQTGRIFEYDWIGGENTSANSRYITFIASSTTWNCSGTCTLEQYGTAHTECAPQEQTCNMPSGSFAGDYDFRVDFSEAVASDVTVSIDEKDGDCNVVNSFEVTVSKGKKTGYGYNVLDQNHNNVVAAYFEITDVSPSSDDTYYYWGNGCDYDDSGNCE